MPIDTITYKQDIDGTFTAFDAESNVYNGSDIQGLVNAYVGTLTGLDLEDVEVTEGGEISNNVKGRLMWYEEADMLISEGGEIISTIPCWLGSPGDTEGEVWAITPMPTGMELLDFPCDFDNGLQLRPVIKILKSSVE